MLLISKIKDTLYYARRDFNSLCIRFVSFFFRPIDNQLAFIPHGGMYGNAYDLRNYKSDNSLSLLVYMIKRYGNSFRFRIACDSRQKENIERDIKNRYPGLDISCVQFFGSKKIRWSSYRELMRSKYIFTCEGYNLPFKRSWHKVVFLGYFKPFKNDYAMHHDINFDRLFDICIAPSSVYSNIVAHTYNVSFSKFVTLGFSRDDMLLTDYHCPELEKAIQCAVDYDVKRVFLYTPTYRDYERKSTEKRDLLGFKVNKEQFEAFLRKNGILLICKIHTTQNNAVLSDNDIKGVLLHSATEEYGLCELMQRADCLITDYTSTYFDYLLLNRPVLFNFYDLEVYGRTRGFTFDPLESIIAGDIFTDEQSFYEASQKLIDGVDTFIEKRSFVKDLMHKYIDTNSSKRICEYVFDKV